MDKEEELKKLDFMYDVLSKKFERQTNDYSALMSKANFLFGFAITLFAGFFAFVFGTNTNILWNIPCFILFITTIFAINQVIKPHTFKDPPPPEHFYTTETLKMDLFTLKDKTVATIDEYYKYNAKIFNDVIKWLEKAQWLLFITFVTIISVNIIIYGSGIEKNTKTFSTSENYCSRPTSSPLWKNDKR